MQLLMFSKMLKDAGNLSVDQVGDCVTEMGFDGVDLTVRPGGHVAPEEVTERLPEAIDTLKSKGLVVPMITTGITGAEEDHAEEIFRTASECGVRFLKLGYWRYREFGTIRDQIEKARGQLGGLEALSRRHGVTAALHTHSGPNLTANPAVVHMLLQDHDPRWLGAYIDPGHMAVEGGKSGWKMGIDLLDRYIKLVAIKDFGWFRETDRRTGEKGWVNRLVPLGEGIVPWPEVFRCLREIGFDGCVSVHSEYPDLSLEELLRQTREDLAYLKRVLGNAS